MSKIVSPYSKPQRNLYYLSLFCLLTACLATVAPLMAATGVSKPQGAGIITVGSGVDCDFATLQLAVTSASSTNTIQMTNETFLADDGVVNITNKSLTIEGGHTSCNVASGTSGYTTLDGTGMGFNDSIIEITDTGGGINITLRNLKIQYGLNDSDGGGAVEISGKSAASLADRIDVTFEHVYLLLNNSDYGGGVHITDGDLTITNESLIRSNSANQDGGGVFCQDGRITLKKDSYIGDAGLFEGNAAVRNGAGVYLDNCDLTLDSSDGLTSAYVNGNFSQSNGGGIYAVDSNVELQSGTFISSNTAEYDGGGIYMRGDGSLSMDGSINLNNASDGGGISLLNAANSYVLANGLISGNEAQFRGGGVELVGTQLSIQGDIVSNSTLSGRGGGIDARDSTVFLQNNASVSSNIASDEGGGISISGDCTISMGSNTEVSGNTAESGGGIASYHSGGNPDDTRRLAVFGGHIFDNIATENGGGIYIEDRSYGQAILTIDSVQVRSNLSPDGGGIYYYTYQGGSSILISNSSIDDNVATVSGGGLYVSSEYSTSEVTISNSLFRDNEATAIGGGMYLKGPTDVQARFTLVGGNSADEAGGVFMAVEEFGSAPKATFEMQSAITGNNAARVAGVKLEGTELKPIEFTMRDGSLSSNSDSSSAGALHSRWATVTLDRVLIANNNSDNVAILFSADSSVNMQNTLAYANTGTISIYPSSNTQLSINESTFVTESNNFSIYDSVSSAQVSIESSIFDGFRDQFSGNASVATHCSLDSTGVLGPADPPEFVDALNHDYHLLPTSSAINKCASGTSLDYDSSVRPVGSGSTPYDIGAYEYQTPLTTKQLSVSIQGLGSVTSSPGSINCGVNCVENFLTGTAVTLTPIAGSGYVFASWSGGCTGSDACVVSMDVVRSVEALFVPGADVLFKDGFE